jgi:hypothetical protein
MNTEPKMQWRCPGCGRTLSTADWTYADLADRGIPICGDCDRDMELLQPSGDSGGPEKPSNAWIIVDTDDRSVVSHIYDNYEECVSDANAMDDSLIIGLVLPDRAAPEEEEPSEATKEILVIMEGALIQEIDGVPPGIVVRVKDYDVDGVDEDRLQQDEDGRRYIESLWTHEDSSGPADEAG